MAKKSRGTRRPPPARGGGAVREGTWVVGSARAGRISGAGTVAPAIKVWGW